MADDTDRIEILLRAQHRDFRRAIDRSNKLLAKFEKDANRHMSRSQKAMDSRLAAMGGSIKTFAAGAVAGVLTGALALVTSEAAQTVRGVAAIGDEARRSGLGVQAFQELSFVATQTRIPVDALIDGMKELNLRADEFVTTGQGPAAEAFARLGLGADALKEGLKDPSELLLDVIDRMEDLDRAAQIRVADEIFGGTGGERFVELMAQGDDGIRQLMARAHELGAVMDVATIEKAAELDRKFGEIQTRVSNLAKKGVVELADAINDAFTVDVDELFGDNADRARSILGDENYEQLKDAPHLVDDVVSALQGLGNTIDEIESRADAFASTLFQFSDQFRAFGYGDVADELNAIALEITELVDKAKDGEISVFDFNDALEDLTIQARSAFDEIAAIDRVEFSSVLAGINSLSVALGRAIEKAASFRATLAAGDPKALQRGPQNGRGGPAVRKNKAKEPTILAPGSSPRPPLPSIDASFGSGGGGGGGGRSGGGGGGGGRAPVSEYKREVEATKEAILELKIEAEALAAVANSGVELGDAMEYARKRAELLVAAQKDGRAITPELTAEIDKLAMAHMEASLAAEEHADRLERVRDHAERGMDALDDMFTSILDGSKSASDVLRDLILQIAKIQASNALRSIFAGSPLTGLLGGLLTPRATGGPMRKGNAYRINEHTPREEVFVPGANGAMLNVPQAQAALSGRGGTTRVQVQQVLRVESTDDLRVVAEEAGSAAGARAAVSTTTQYARIQREKQRRNGI
ncbi:hypothetical protein [Marinovum algicola]|uniref:hypothetical protein n=1 Tax=Marinovum algicola TaxID=42444 RepID=UPI003B51DA0E